MPYTLHIAFITSFTAQYMAWICTSTVVLHPILTRNHPETLFQMLFLAAVPWNAWLEASLRIWRHTVISSRESYFGLTELLWNNEFIFYDLFMKIFYYENLELCGSFPTSTEAAGVNRPQQICCVKLSSWHFQETQPARLTGCTRY